MPEGSCRALRENTQVSHADYHQYPLGVVTGEATIGANIIRNFFAGVRGLSGGRSAAYKKKLCLSREIVFEDMQALAEEPGVDAIVGVGIDYETVGETGDMLMGAVAGTAVKLD